ncbi:unnamed protein product [Sphenostylis stenocarpa]|uniref:Uncharacterized protein n=1 Tax=Sphenostylis stenocarpa TaxID=92480 RepID=A0AA86VSU1_9FABA|nr:unnamed protein product [Sphenostylis stenocarpa]
MYVRDTCKRISSDGKAVNGGQLAHPGRYTLRLLSSWYRLPSQGAGWGRYCFSGQLEMIQEGGINSKFCDYSLGNCKMDLSNRDKQLHVAVKKTALRDLQNDNKIMVPTSTGSSSVLKDKDPGTDSNKVSGTKRPLSDYAVNQHLQQSPGNNSANGHLVYVRRKSEAELGKGTAFENPSISAYCSHSKQLCCGEETAQPKSQIKEPPQIKESKVSCFPAFAPFPMASSVNSSGKPSIPISIGKSPMKLAQVESNYVTSSGHTTTIGNPKGLKNLHWEERYQQLQMFLRRLDQSDQEEYIQMLRSLSSVELSKHAVELEKRSIQLSLEEAKELKRVAVLNVLGKSVKNFKAPADHDECADKLKPSS